MNKQQPEFSRPLPVEEVGEGVQRAISANPAELQALARRMKLPAIRSLQAELDVAPEKGGAVMVRGQMKAEVEQECVRTLEVFPAQVDVAIERLFVPADSLAAKVLEEGGGTDLDVETDDEPDIIRNGEIDLGELVAEYLALALDPWPKKPGTDFVDVEVGASTTPDMQAEREQANPFEVLQHLKQDEK